MEAKNVYWRFGLQSFVGVNARDHDKIRLASNAKLVKLVCFSLPSCQTLLLIVFIASSWKQ